jgi:hypothetical protein
MKIRPVEAAFFHADRQAEMPKQTFAGSISQFCERA